MENKLQQQVAQTLAEAHNLLASATLTVRGDSMKRAGDALEGLREVIVGLTEGRLRIEEVRDLAAPENNQQGSDDAETE